MNFILLLALFLNSSFANTCNQKLLKTDSNVSLGPFSKNPTKVAAQRLKDLYSSWEKDLEKDVSLMSESEKIGSLVLIRELFSDQKLQTFFLEEHLGEYEDLATQIVRTFTDKLYLGTGDLARFKHAQWGELVVFFELRRLHKPLDKIVLGHLANGLERFYRERGHHHQKAYERLIDQIIAANERLSPRRK